MAEQSDIDNLRVMLGEIIPDGGSEADTLFTDDQMGLWVDSNPNLERAAYDGWRAKAAQLANLVNVTDGAASREFASAFDHARQMINEFERSSSGSTEGRSRIGRIVRR